MAESDSDQSSVDPSDIIERYVDSDASALSQSPPPIHDLSAEVARLLDHYFSPSEESDDARSPELSLAVPHRRRHWPQIELQRVVPFGVESTTSSTAARRSINGSSNEGRQYALAEERHDISRGGADLSKPTTTGNLITIRSGPIEGNDGILPSTATSQQPTSPEEAMNLALPLAIQRLQSSESIRCLVAGSLQGSARSSLSQLSDECAAKPLAEELEEAEGEEKLRNEAVFFENFETDSSSVSYSGEEGSGEEGSLLSENIDFELHDEDSETHKVSTEQEATSLAATQSISTERRTNVASSIEIIKEQSFQVHPKSESSTTQNGTLSSKISATMTTQAPNSPTGYSKTNQKASTFQEPSSDQDSKAQHSQPRTPTLPPPPVNTMAAKQPAREVSSGLGNLLQGQISNLGLGSRRSAQTESEKPDPGTQHKKSNKRVSVCVKRFSRQTKPVTPPPPRRAREISAEGLQEKAIHQHSPVPIKETGTPTDRPREAPESKEFRWNNLSYTDSEDSLSSSESEEIMSPTPNKPLMLVPVTDTERENGTLSKALPKCELNVNPKVNKPALDSQRKDSEFKTPHTTNNLPDALLSAASVVTSEPEPLSALKTALAQHPGHSPSLKITSSAGLPLKGILKKRSRFERTESTSTDLTTVTPMSSRASSCSSLDNAAERSSTLVQGALSTETAFTRQPMLSQLCRTSSSLSSSDEGCDFERTLTEEPAHAATTDHIVPYFEQPTYTDSEATLVTSGENNPPHTTSEEAFKNALKTQLQNTLLTSSPITARRHLANHPLSKMEVKPATSNNLNPDHQNTQLIGDRSAPDRTLSTVQTLASDDLRDRVSSSLIIGTIIIILLSFSNLHR